MSNYKVFNKQTNSRVSYVKEFYQQNPNSDLIWKYSDVNILSISDPNILSNLYIYENLVTTCKDIDVFIQKNLILGGEIIYKSDLTLKTNIEDLNIGLANQLLNIVPKKYTIKKDNETDNKMHYGFITEEVEKNIPELVNNIDESIYGKIKSVNIIEMVPLLLLKIKDLQNQIDELKSK